MLKNNVYKNWSDAIAYGKEYAPSGYESHAVLGRGKWSVPDTANCFRSFYDNVFETLPSGQVVPLFMYQKVLR